MLGCRAALVPLQFVDAASGIHVISVETWITRMESACRRVPVLPIQAKLVLGGSFVSVAVAPDG